MDSSHRNRLLVFTLGTHPFPRAIYTQLFLPSIKPTPPQISLSLSLWVLRTELMNMEGTANSTAVANTSTLASSSPVIVSPCAACKILRRRCADKCVLAPYFPPTEPLKFTIAHRVFGASNIIKFLQVSWIPRSSPLLAQIALVET